MHWSVKQRLGKPAIVDETKYLRYAPKNLPANVEYTEPTQLENDYIAMCRSDKDHKKRKACALYRDLAPEKGLVNRWRTRRYRRFREEWAKDEATPA